MQKNTNNDFIINIEDQINEIYELYKKKINRFQSLFMGLMAFALLFFIFVLYPYITMQIDNKEISSKMVRLQKKISETQLEKKKYTKVQGGIKILKEEIRNSPEYLRNFILNLGQPPNYYPQRVNQAAQYIQRQNSQEPVSLDTSNLNDFYENKINEEVINMFSRFEKILENDIIKPLLDENKIDDSSKNITEFRIGIDSLKKSFNREFKNNPKFWERYSDKEVFSVALLSNVNNFWSDHGVFIDLKNRELIKKFWFFDSMKTDIENNYKFLTERQEGLKVRLSEIEFPFGKIPLGLNDAVLVYPILLVIGVLICISLLCESIRLLTAYHKYVQNQEPENAILASQKIVLLTPLWLNSLFEKQKQHISNFIILLPFLFYLISLFLIMFNWTITKSPDILGQLPSWVYGLFYILGIGAFTYAYWLIKKEVQNYFRYLNHNL